MQALAAGQFQVGSEYEWGKHWRGDADDLSFCPSWPPIPLGRAKSQMQALAAGQFWGGSEDEWGKDGRGDAYDLSFSQS